MFCPRSLRSRFPPPIRGSACSPFHERDSNSGFIRSTCVRPCPLKRPEELLGDLVATTPGDEGKWFATAKEVGLFDEAIRLANQAPCDPKTLTRAARDFAAVRPEFAVEAGLAALHWLVQGYGYEITSADVWAAYTETMKASERAGCAGDARDRIRTLVASETSGDRFVTRTLGRALGL